MGFFSEKNVSQLRKKLKGGPFSLVRYCILRGAVPWATGYNLGSS